MFAQLRGCVCDGHGVFRSANRVVRFPVCRVSRIGSVQENRVLGSSSEEVDVRQESGERVCGRGIETLVELAAPKKNRWVVSVPPAEDFDVIIDVLGDNIKSQCASEICVDGKGVSTWYDG